MSYDNCPKCKNPLEGSKLSCADCGWSKRKSNTDHREDGVRPWPVNCEYIDGVDRCRFPAVFSPSPKGGGPYYCRFHARSQGSLVDSLVCKQSQTYKPETAEELRQEFEGEVAASLKKHGLERQQGEAKQAWIERMRQFCREGAREIAKRGVDTPITRRVREPGDDDDEIAA